MSRINFYEHWWGVQHHHTDMRKTALIEDVLAKVKVQLEAMADPDPANPAKIVRIRIETLGSRGDLHDPAPPAADDDLSFAGRRLRSYES